MSSFMSSPEFRELWTEPRPVPLGMTDTEILDWLNEYCDEYRYLPQTSVMPSRFVVTFSNGEAIGPSLRDAVCQAAAKWKAANE